MTQVSMISVRALAAAVEGASVEPARFLAATGVSADEMGQPDARVTAERYARIRRAALEVSGDPALGLHMGGQVSAGRYDVLGALVEQSSCLREAVQLAARYGRIFMAGPQLALDEQADAAIIRCSLPRDDSPEARLTAEFVMSSLLYLVRCFAGASAEPRAALFAYAPPAHRAEYTRIFAGRERFDQPCTGLCIDRRWLDLPHVYRSPQLHALLQTRAEQLLAKVDESKSQAERVRAWLSGEPLAVRPAMIDVARALGTSARTLRRGLTREGVRFDDLVEEARAARARRMLSEANRSVQEIGYALGYATPAAFSRAFRRWTGMAPSAYRAPR